MACRDRRSRLYKCGTVGAVLDTGSQPALDSEQAFVEKPVSFGRQKNLVRRPVRPDGRVTRELRRRAVGKTSLLDAQTAKPSLSLRLARVVAKLFKRQ